MDTALITAFAIVVFASLCIGFGIGYTVRAALSRRRRAWARSRTLSLDSVNSQGWWFSPPERIRPSDSGVHLPVTSTDAAPLQPADSVQSGPQTDGALLAGIGKAVAQQCWSSSVPLTRLAALAPTLHGCCCRAGGAITMSAMPQITGFGGITSRHASSNG